MPGYDAYLNLDKEMIARSSIVDPKSNLRIIQDYLDRAYACWWCDTFMIDNALVIEEEYPG